MQLLWVIDLFSFKVIEKKIVEQQSQPSPLPMRGKPVDSDKMALFSLSFDCLWFPEWPIMASDKFKGPPQTISPTKFY